MMPFEFEVVAPEVSNIKAAGRSSYILCTVCKFMFDEMPQDRPLWETLTVTCQEVE